ncbi:MAG: hypothetical protein ACO1NO_14105 [Burkholderiaceae bacterium]
MEKTVAEEVTMPAGELDDLFNGSVRTRPEPEKPRRFNYSKLQAVLCMSISAVISVAGIAWLADG